MSGVNGAEMILNVSGFAPNVFEVLAVELGALINDQVLGADLLGGHDAIQGRSDFFGCRPKLEHGASHGPPGEMVNHVEDPPTDRPTLPDGVGKPVGPEPTGDRHSGQISMKCVPRTLRDDAALLARIVDWMWGRRCG